MRRADRPNLGVCLDSFHILSRGHDPAQIESIPGDRIFFLQLADAPALSMDVLAWSRHHRLFPGEGSFPLTDFLAHARRSLTWLADRTAAAQGWQAERLPAPQTAAGVDFVEIAGEDLAPVDELLSQLGFRFGGRHVSKPVRLWSAGEARVILNEQRRDPEPRIAALGLTVDDAGSAADRAVALGAPAVFRRSYAGEQRLRAVAAPDGTEVYWKDRPEDISWIREFVGGEAAGDAFDGTVDHINLGYAWQDYDEAVLFAASVLGLDAEVATEVPGPVGLLCSQVMRTSDGVLRVPINLAPPAAPVPPRHVAIRCDDVLAAVAHARAVGAPLLEVPDNYYDDLAARLGGALDPMLLARMRELGVLYDADGAGGEFLHAYTVTFGQVFIELCERRGGYDGYGALNAPGRMAAQRRAEALQPR